jgi:6-phosphogluconolactonase
MPIDRSPGAKGLSVKNFVPEGWPISAAMQIQRHINVVLRDQDECSVMLTGGRSAERLYVAWHRLPGFHMMTGVRFFFGDERCVPPHDPESNYGMVMRTLFTQGVPEGCSVCRIEADQPDRDAAAWCYEDILPDNVDVMLLGAGDDGHIASLFPASPALQEKNRRVVPVSGPKPPCDRLTITPPVISQARYVFVLAPGSAKAKVLSDALEDPDDFNTLPARLVLNATWLLDSGLPEAIVP